MSVTAVWGQGEDEKPLTRSDSICGEKGAVAAWSPRGMPPCSKLGAAGLMYDLTTEHTEMDEYGAVQLEDSDMALTTQSRTWKSMQLSPQPGLLCC